MMRWMARLMLLLVMLPVVPLRVHAASISSSPSLAPAVRLSVLITGRTSFQRNALAEVGITLKNVSGHDLQLATATCRLPYLFAEVVDPSGKILFPPAAATEPESPCVPPPASPPIHPGSSVSMGGFLVLRAGTVRPVAQVLSGSTPVVVRGAPITLPLYNRPAVHAVIHRLPVVYAQLEPARNGFTEATYRYWYTCKTASGTLRSEEHPQSVLHWDYGQGSDIHPRFNSTCTQVLEWHAVAGFLFSPVTQIDDTTPFTPRSTPVPKTPSNATTARARYTTAFQALDTISHFAARQMETRLAYPERGVPDGLVNEAQAMQYLAPDRLLTTSRALNPVGTLTTQRYVQVGPVSCSLDPFNFPAHTWQPYPYDAFTYRNHRPDIGQTAMEGMRLSYTFPKRSGGHGPPQPVTTVQFSSEPGAVSTGGSRVSVRIIHIHVRSLYANTFTRIKYRGRLYPPSRSDETAKLTVNASSHLPMLFQSTTHDTIGKGIHLLVARRQITFDYDTVPKIEVPSSTCE